VSSLADTSNPSLLWPESFSAVQATAAVVAEHADQITAHFYPRMFDAHPELLRVFNQGNQATGEQSKAVASSVVAYAVQLIDPEAPSFSVAEGSRGEIGARGQ
jgi:nitric oxide dioxygenase